MQQPFPGARVESPTGPELHDGRQHQQQPGGGQRWQVRQAEEAQMADEHHYDPDTDREPQVAAQPSQLRFVPLPRCNRCRCWTTPSAGDGSVTGTA